MRLLLARARFAHAWLWQRDETYRIAVVLGPPVLLGLGLALGGAHELARVRAGTAPAWLARTWAAIPWPGGTPSGAAGWAKPLPGAGLPQDGTVTAIDPDKAMPPDGAAAALSRLAPGWLGQILSVQGREDLDLGLADLPLGTIDLPKPALDMASLVAAAPGPGRHVLAGSGIWLVRDGGRLALSVRITRLAGHDAAPANCLSRVGIGHVLAVSDVQIGLPAGKELVYAPVQLDLKAGFYRIGFAFGCWHGDGTPAAASAAVVTGRPDGKALSPLSPAVLYHPRDP